MAPPPPSTNHSRKTQSHLVAGDILGGTEQEQPLLSRIPHLKRKRTSQNDSARPHGTKSLKITHTGRSITATIRSILQSHQDHQTIVRIY
ncbi:hypothetical protein GOBAR_DD25571 [Gossypium barbadense]|nr:hypothetical protein GOBAR_DD25571 [Gossypium barbadense]